MSRYAFTLIELLVVLAIISLLSSMIFLVPKANVEDKVQNASRLLAATLEQARNMAMKSGNIHGVVFHIENAGDGSVLRNSSSVDGEWLTQDGQVLPVDESNRTIAERRGHWYAIIGPDPEDRTGASAPPEVYWYTAFQGAPRPILFARDYRAAVKRAIVGEPIPLESGVRFLALSDWDLGSGGWYDGSTNRMPYGVSSDHYPRPWCGVYDAEEGRVYAWGGYDRELENGARMGETGFCYQGNHQSGGNAESVPYDRLLDANVYDGYWIIWDEDNLAYGPHVVDDNLFSQTGFDHYTYNEKAAQQSEMQKEFGWDGNTRLTGPFDGLDGQAKPLLDAYLIDYAIYFKPDGSAFVADSVGRCAYRRADNLVHTWHDLQVGGGVTLTLAADVDPLQEYAGAPLYDTSNVASSGSIDFTNLPSQAAWLASFSPFRRITVQFRSGTVVVKDMDHPDCQVLDDDGRIKALWSEEPL